MQRCPWAKNDLYIQYHDTEWGVPVHDECTLFEFLTLEGAQAGLSWETILKKRSRYREVFAGFDPARVARPGCSETRGSCATGSRCRARSATRGRSSPCSASSGALTRTSGDSSAEPPG